MAVDAEFTLSEDEARTLRDLIDEGLALRGQGADGQYLSLRLNDLVMGHISSPGRLGGDGTLW